MRHALSLVAEWLRPALRRGLIAAGIFALVIASASTVSAPRALGLFDAHHGVASADCISGGDGCTSHDTGKLCTQHGGCVATGVLPASPLVAVAPGRDWAAPAGVAVADWTEFPHKPPPISL